MLENERKWSDCTDEEKLLIIEGYLEGMVALDDTNRQVNNQRLEWIREHIPAYNLDDGKNYIFVSYSHLDYKEVYKDLAVFSYNSQRRVRFWYDEGLPIGQNWEEAAGKIIKNPHCVGVLFYLSKNLLLSPSVYKEIECVKNSGKSYCQVALSDTLYSAAKIFDDAKGSELRGVRQHQDELEEFFPDNETALISYGKENAISRIEKIARQFDVTEEVFSDFVCEECEGGLSLIEYRGIKTEVHIPEKIGDKPIVKITAEFPHAVSVFIPKTVFHINRDIFDSAINLEEITVDENNPKYYDINGVLCERDCPMKYWFGSGENSTVKDINEEKTGDIIMRAPICWDWKKQFLDYKTVDKIDFKKTIIHIAYSGEYDEFFPNDEKDDMTLSYFIDLFFGRGVEKFLYESYDYEWFITKFEELFAFIMAKLKRTTKREEFDFGYAVIKHNTSKLYRILRDLKNYSVFSNIEVIADDAFKNCKIPYLFLSDNIKIIDSSAFESSSLVLIFLPQDLTEIKGLFCNCRQLQSVLTDTKYYETHKDLSFDKALLFGKINCIGGSAFRNTAIRGVELSTNIDITMGALFAECIWIKELFVPGNVKSLRNMFAKCLRLKKVVLGEGIEEIMWGCFIDCISLKFIEIPKTVKFIEDNCFNGCDNLKTINYGGTKDDWFKLENAKDEKFSYYKSLQLSKNSKVKIICKDGVIEPSENT